MTTKVESLFGDRFKRRLFFTFFHGSNSFHKWFRGGLVSRVILRILLFIFFRRIIFDPKEFLTEKAKFDPVKGKFQ